ncbi:hypothetical protein PSAB6_410170 [Paraburkholderia sabiae]|nr:hypothetical protein PSAB6_410170 [Paraburkholderia sabiae]
MCRLPRLMRWRFYDTDPAFQSGVVHLRRDRLHTVCHLGGRGLPGNAVSDAGVRSG